MDTRTYHPELLSMAKFRDALPDDVGDRSIGERLCAIGRFTALAKGQELIARNNDNLLVFIAAGHAKLIAGNQSDDSAAKQILAFHFPGDIVSVVPQSDGEICLGALGELQLIIFDTDQFLDTAQDEPAVVRSVLSKSLNALQRSRTKLVELGYKTASQRLAGFLVSIEERLCGCSTRECEISLPMSRSDIAESLGLTIETISRQFSLFRQAGLLTTSGRHLVQLHDLEALRKAAGP